MEEDYGIMGIMERFVGGGGNNVGVFEGSGDDFGSDEIGDVSYVDDEVGVDEVSDFVYVFVVD